MVREAIAARDASIVIFGTDIDPNAIAMARAGRYIKQPSGLSQGRFERWFIQYGDHYCPIKEIRDLSVFSIHSIAARAGSPIRAPTTETFDRWVMSHLLRRD